MHPTTGKNDARGLRDSTFSRPSLGGKSVALPERGRHGGISRKAPHGAGSADFCWARSSRPTCRFAVRAFWPLPMLGAAARALPDQ